MMAKINYVVIRPYNGDSVYTKPLTGVDIEDSDKSDEAMDFLARFAVTLQNIDVVALQNSKGYPTVLTKKVLENSMFFFIHVPEGQNPLEVFKNGAK